MRGTSLESFLLVFMFKSLVTIGSPISDLDSSNSLEDNSIELSLMEKAATSIDDTAASVTPYVCAYIPPDLSPCNFISYQKYRESFLLERKLLERNKLKLKLLDSKKQYLSRSLVPVPGTEQFLKQLPIKTVKPVKTIIYEISKCVPPRLPFVLPWCTSEDLSAKNREVQLIYPFVT